MKNSKAITLIALIITIIVLLILAGITINMVLGENGLISKSKTSVGKYENAQEKENTALAGYENEIDNATRDTVTIDKAEYEQLKKDATTLIINGTTPDSTTWAKISDYPTGYGMNDIYLKSYIITMETRLFRYFLCRCRFYV